ncbi:MAG TPA: EpsI family protein [Pirellulales bacterium]|nr:EpsI family protein [Pirellulales bacterium]
MRLIIALTLILGSELAIRVTRHSLLEQSAAPPETALSTMPLRIDEWRGSDIELDRRLFRRTGAYQMINRTYKNPVGDRIDMNLGVWLNYDVAIPHKPEICYPAAGWDIVSRQPVRIFADGPGSFTARMLILEKRTERIAVLYWVTLGDSIALDDDDIRQSLQKTVSVGKSRPPAIKCMLQADGDDPSRAERQLVEFAEVVSPHLRQFEQQ